MTMLPPELPPNVHARTINTVSYVLVAVMIAAVLWLHLLPAVIVGSLIYALARKLGACLHRCRTLSQRAEAIMVVCVFMIAALILTALGIGIDHLVEYGRGLKGMLTRIVDVLNNLRESLPTVVASYVPQSVTELRVQPIQMIKKYGHQVSTLGTNGLRASTLILVGLILGVMMVWLGTPDSEHRRPLVTALVNRLSRLIDAFEAVVFAWVKISALNTALAAIYLLSALPLFGQHVPYSRSLILLTFAAGPVPVANNPISSAAIIVMSVTTSLELAAALLIFLVVVHKLEYFVNAYIISSRIDARAWKLVLALIAMEALFGVGGVIAVSVLYVCIKRELADVRLIG